MLNLSAANLIGGCVFGSIGFVAFVYGKRMNLWKPMFLGIAFTANYRLIVYCAVVVAFDLLRSGRSIRGLSRAASLWLGGLAIAPALWQAADLLARARGIVLFRSEITGRPTLYVQQALYQLHGGKQSVFLFSPLPYVQWYVWREGIALSFLVLAGIAVIVLGSRGSREESWRQRIVVALIVIPYAVYSFAPFVTPRNLDATVPFACIAAAAGLLAQIGHRPDEANAYLRASGNHLDQALTFYRSVGATRYIRKAESILATSA